MVRNDLQSPASDITPQKSLGSGDDRALTWRSCVVGLSGVVVLCAITPYNDYRLHQTYLYGNHFPLGCLFFFLVVVLGLNTGLRTLRREWALRERELLGVWVMLASGAGLASSGLMRYLGPLPVAPFYFATSSNGWANWSRYIPDWMVLSHDGGSPVIRWFFEGIPMGQAIPWRPWIPVFLWWGLLFGMLIGLTLSLSILLRQHWVESERLAFPLVYIPIEMAREPESGLLNAFLRNRLMWLGCGLAIFIHLLNGLHSYCYAIPNIPLQWDMSTSFPDRPWNALGIGGIEIFLSVIGLMFLVPTEVSFSVWGFFVLFRLLRVVRSAMGVDGIEAGFPNHEAAIGIGGFVVWGAWMVWSGRARLSSIWKTREGAPEAREDSREPISARAASIIACACFLGVVMWTIAAGVSPLFAMLMWAGITLILVILSRIVAESGLLFVQSPFVPTDALSALPGPHLFNYTGFGSAMMIQTVFISDPREALMPTLMNSLRLKGEGNGRDIVAAIMMAVAVGYVVSFISFLVVSYRYGGVTLDSWGSIRAPKLFYDQIAAYSAAPARMNMGAIANMVLGGSSTWLLLVMRGRFLWCGLHPLGVLLAGTYAIQRIWFSVFITWALKWLLLKYGGLRAFKTLLPFFIGMVVGEGIIGGIWLIVGMLTGVGTPGFLPS